MTRRRWIADIWDDHTATLTGDHAAHLSRVLRARIGQEFEIAVGDGIRLSQIESISENQVVFRLGEPVDIAPPAPVSIVLSIFKFDRFEWAVEKLTELAIQEIFPVVASRTGAGLVAAAAKRAARWRRIALEASEQSRRNSPPIIHDPVSLKLLRLPTAGRKLVLSETERAVSLTSALDSVSKSESPSIAFAVGPEGGWTQPELDFFKEQAWQNVSLGRTILRSETAAISAAAIITSRINY